MVCRNPIEAETYALQVAVLDDEERRAQERVEQPRRPIPEISAAVAAGEQLLRDLRTLWDRLDACQRAAFLEDMYPGGLISTAGTIGTAGKHWYHLDFGDSPETDSREVPPTGFEPV